MIQMIHRRKFLYQTLGLSAAWAFLQSCTSTPKSSPVATRKAIAVTTWDADLAVNKVAWQAVDSNKSSLDAVEAAAIAIEENINCCVGLGGNPDRDGRVTLDACIMDDKFNCGSVAYLQRIKHPISVARRVMEKTPHVMLVGDGAQQFAVSEGFSLESDELSPGAKKEYENWLKKSEYKPVINIELRQASGAPPMKLSNGDYNHDTMGILAIDKKGNVSGACTTSGMGFKMAGRIGDSPIIGSGLYVDNAVGAAVASGQGEEVIRVCGTHLVVEFMRQGMTPQEACKKAIQRIIDINPQKAKDFQVGFLAVDLYGNHGSYAIHPGFTYGVTTDDGQSLVIKSPSHLST
jgi:N4-(beta-N-acetylglucosaminyl)-L-asparaginase